MIKFSSSNLNPDHIALLEQWFVSEWGEVSSFESSHNGKLSPPPVIVTEHDKLLGGLVFTWARKPKTDDMGIWINAVFVSPEYRRLGLASKLVDAAELEAGRNEVKELFVYTEFSSLYEKLGWQDQENSGESKVLSKTITSN